MQARVQRIVKQNRATKHFAATRVWEEIVLLGDSGRGERGTVFLRPCNTVADQSALAALPGFAAGLPPPSEPAVDGNLVFSVFGGIDFGPSEQPMAKTSAATKAA